MGIAVGISLLLMAVAGLINTFSAGAKGFRNLVIRDQFANLGVVKGKTKKEITDYVGDPTHVSILSDGRELCQWVTTNYHVALVFEGGVCGGITHESTSK